MTQPLSKQVETGGTKISKEKLIELIKKSPSKEFFFSSNPTQKIMVVNVPG